MQLHMYPQPFTLEHSMWFPALLLVFLVAQCSGYREAIIAQHTTSSTTEIPVPWHRTIYGTKIELVRPTVIAGVTFSASPAPTPDPMQPWVSLKKEGIPVTITPEIKKGRTVKASPDYSTYFKKATTIIHSYEDLKAHNMDPEEVHTEIRYEDEDKTYVSLNPVIRCTPERYFMVGHAKVHSSKPFCTPHEEVEWKADETYFITWYTNFFEDAAKDAKVEHVRIHLSYVSEVKSQLAKRDMSATFFSSAWVKNVDGVYPVKIESEWLQNRARCKIVVSVQPETTPDDEFDHLEHGIVLNMLKHPKVGKTSKEDHEKAHSIVHHTAWYYIALTVPCAVLAAIILMYLFIRFNGRYRDFSDVKRAATAKKHKVLGKFKDLKRFKNVRNHKYTELPTYKPRKTQ